ncbi:MAG: glutamate 5-kinase [Rhodobacteraceae bacterium]|nr:glutamate 5-kinase [Paracoccaceae bacterium]
MEALSADIIGAAKVVVLKIGSALLVQQGALREAWLGSIAQDVMMLKAQGKAVLIVSSGSIALGRGVLNLPTGDLPLEQAQAAAAVGQIRLAHAYQAALKPHEIETAQVLLTLEDSQNRRRYLNTRATLNALLGLGVVPIVNENDTVATDEIRYGDNDRLGAQVASLIGADVLVLFSDIDGLYSADPRLNPEAGHISEVSEITHEIEDMAGDPGSAGASGGMRTKLMAARIAMDAGCAMAIAKGEKMRPVQGMLAGERCTWFKAKQDPASARKRWISAMKMAGIVSIDAGAARALRGGKSLLPAGVRAIEGKFERGDPVEIRDENGDLVAKGLVAYSAQEAAIITGANSREIETRLGYKGRSALIHRDNMAI